MIKIAIVEDDFADRKKLKEMLAYFFKKEEREFTVDEFSSAVDFFLKYQPIYDLVLMDIDMPEMDGMEAARRLRKLDLQVLLIFVTNIAKYAIKGYEVEALDFILKPVDKYSFSLKMERVLARISANKGNSILIHTDNLESIVIQIPSIKYIEVSGHYVIYHTRDGEYTQYSTLKKVEEQVKHQYFVKCNRCFLVNLNYVDSISKDQVIIGKESLSISRPQKKAFLNAFSDYIGGRR